MRSRYSCSHQGTITAVALKMFTSMKCGTVAARATPRDADRDSGLGGARHQVSVIQNAKCGCLGRIGKERRKSLLMNGRVRVERDVTSFSGTARTHRMAMRIISGWQTSSPSFHIALTTDIFEQQGAAPSRQKQSNEECPLGEKRKMRIQGLACWLT